ncbi:methyltransferase-like protein 5 isoform X2 [Centruroides sculpturatus]|uniref:methyltransferase-like protein 5 isoform X2 n=1 Tax=Centruroides sculpturatus TaxID=218467 RepID=UPI000C6E1F75|nr:methyltransferase-like protein 5 isoform X2 [Centruroides sculpturatus]
MKLKELKSVLQQMETFHKSKYQLEQYTTPADIAAKMLYMIHTASGLGNAVADLGCGCGILAIGASLLGADICIGVDVDDEALSVCLANCEKLEVTNVDLIQMDVVHLADSRWSKVFDTVVMNPPFGTKKRKGNFTNLFSLKNLKLVYLYLLGDNGDGGLIPGIKLSKNTIIQEKIVVTIPNIIGIANDAKRSAKRNK